ncbi:hypothetical protein CP965_01250 [Halarcobacter mediterraneus]|uniref:Transglutaminase-like domain-containing protein n=1 Tax=Halarcobacter mediterraneus TaxID=2023153 RepID=A0A4Q1AZI6_9BACT|nr:hypothetical protein [Halarcobacter mediterraneus]RXK14102.1 hypothetical protein CP965_01250 [Halarcobacter mediterraneus]
MRIYLLSFLFIIFFSACSTKNISYIKIENKTNSLYKTVTSTSKRIDKEEAKNFSKDIILYSKFLAHSYGVTTYALFHNTLINLGIKDKGLCYHYANDLLSFLKRKKYKSFEFKRIIANRNEYFEHSALILTRKDISFENSIVLDAWRNTGNLYFSKVKNDKNYEWELK